MGVGSWEGRNFYQIRPASEVCNFYKIRPEIWDQLLHFEARFQFFSAGAPPSAAVLGSNFRLVRLDLGPVQDVGIPVREHSAGIKTSKSEFWGGENLHFFRPCRRHSPPRGGRCSTCHREAAPDGNSALQAAFTALWPGPQLLPTKPPL